MCVCSALHEVLYYLLVLLRAVVKRDLKNTSITQIENAPLYLKDLAVSETSGPEHTLLVLFYVRSLHSNLLGRCAARPETEVL